MRFNNNHTALIFGSFHQGKEQRFHFKSSLLIITLIQNHPSDLGIVGFCEQTEMLAFESIFFNFFYSMIEKTIKIEAYNFWNSWHFMDHFLLIKS